MADYKEVNRLVIVVDEPTNDQLEFFWQLVDRTFNIRMGVSSQSSYDKEEKTKRFCDMLDEPNMLKPSIEENKQREKDFLNSLESPIRNINEHVKCKNCGKDVQRDYQKKMCDKCLNIEQE